MIADRCSRSARRASPHSVRRVTDISSLGERFCTLAPHQRRATRRLVCRSHRAVRLPLWAVLAPRLAHYHGCDHRPGQAAVSMLDGRALQPTPGGALDRFYRVYRAQGASRACLVIGSGRPYQPIRGITANADSPHASALVIVVRHATVIVHRTQPIVLVFCPCPDQAPRQGPASRRGAAGRASRRADQPTRMWQTRWPVTPTRKVAEAGRWQTTAAWRP